MEFKNELPAGRLSNSIIQPWLPARNWHI